MNQTISGAPVQSRFIAGSEWVYFKLYSGPASLERTLVQEVYPVVEALLSRKIIDRFFFVRYHDPAAHLRLRFRVISEDHVGIVISSMHRQFAVLCEKRIVWKFCLDTYSRELTRYGVATIEGVEQLFFFDSLFIMQALSIDQMNENERVAIGMSYIDRICSVVFLSDGDKLAFIKSVSNSYLAEFPLTDHVKILLDKRYRENGKALVALYNGDYAKEIYRNYPDPASLLKRIINDCGTDSDLQGRLLNSIIHMHFNRLFKTDQRKYETLAYYFLWKYLNSCAVRENK